MSLCSWGLSMLVVFSAAASGGELAVLVEDAHGALVADAVVTVRGETDVFSQFAPTTKTIDQRDETFVPYIEIFRPGDQVVFRNSDRTRHHVYSFAKPKSFEFVIAPGQTAPPVTLDHVGAIAVGCNIHDRMIAYLYVSDAANIAKSGADGRAVFANLRPATYTVRVWYPQLRPGRPDPQQTVTLDASGATVTFTLALLPDPREGEPDRSRY